jgi:uncharacterized protein YdbL (DUF1318 family)
METIVFAGVIIALAGVAIWYYNRGSKGLDVNNDGKVDLDDAKQAVANTTQGIVEDTRDLALSLASDSAARAAVALERIKKPRAATTKKPAKKTTAAKPSATKASKPRATRSTK